VQLYADFARRIRTDTRKQKSKVVSSRRVIMSIDGGKPRR
jgi:hypothetical protein